MTKDELTEKYLWTGMLADIDLIGIYKDLGTKHFPGADEELRKDLDAYFKWKERNPNG